MPQAVGSSAFLTAISWSASAVDPLTEEAAPAAIFCSVLPLSVGEAVAKAAGGLLEACCSVSGTSVASVAGATFGAAAAVLCTY